MTGTKIHAEERSVGDIFTDNYRFSIPRYQRPYAWTTEQAGEMLDDLVQAARCEHDLSSSDPYFLGSVVLVKAHGDARAEEDHRPRHPHPHHPTPTQRRAFELLGATLPVNLA